MKTEIWLGSGNGITLDFIRPAVFGELVKLATAKMENYQSDLYHDATWLHNFLDGPMTFYYSLNEYGTHIGTDPNYHRQYRYKMTVVNDRDRWTLVIESL